MKPKYKRLLGCIFYDLIGLVSYVIPVVGELSDLLWAPIAALLMLKMFPNSNKRHIAALVVFVEEITFFDYIPTFTLMWVYTHWIAESRDS